ncbi:hypothetical protein [Flavobacterium sp.]
MLGLFFCVPFSLSDNNEIKHTEVNSKTIIANNDIYKFLGRKNKYRYRIWSTEHKSSFVIEPEGGIAANWKDLDNIKKNDTLIIEIGNNREVDLDNKSEAIPIFSLIKNNKIVYDLESYNKAKKEYDRRWNIIFIIMSILLIARGFNVFSSKTSYILAGLSVLIIIFLKILNIW